MATNGNGGSQFALTVRRAANLPMETWSDERIAAIARTVAPPDAGPAEVAMFLAVAARYDLDPFLREIWLVKDGGRLMVLTGRDSFLKTARSNPKYQGYRAEAIHEGDSFEVEFNDAGVKIDHRIPGWDRGKLAAAFCAVYVEGRPPILIVRKFSDYAHLHGKNNWKLNPEDMLLARVITAAHRLAFNISGMYTPDEAADVAFHEENDSARAESGTKGQLEELKAKLARKKAEVEAEKAEIQDAEFTVLPDEPEVPMEASLADPDFGPEHGVTLPDWDKDPTIPANPDDDPRETANARSHKPPKTSHEKARDAYFATWNQIRDHGMNGIPAISGMMSLPECEILRANWNEKHFGKRSAAHFSEDEFRQAIELLKEGIDLFDPAAMSQGGLPV